MRIDIGAGVKTREGTEIGKVDRVVADPDTRELEALVVKGAQVLSRNVVVAVSLIQQAGPRDVMLRVGQDDLVDLPDFVERHYVPGVPKVQVVWPYAPGSVLFPLAPPYSIHGIPGGKQPQGQEWEAATEDVDISEGTEVRTVDGSIGVVDEVLTDPLADRATAIAVKKGAGLSRDVRIPVEFIAEVAEDHLKLNLTTQQVEEFPIPTTGR